MSLKIKIKKPKWSVLNDDFVMGSKLKDWKNDNEQEIETEIIKNYD